MEELGKVLQHLLDWGRRHGAIFDKNKTNLILFTKRKITPPLAQFGDQDLTFRNKVKWLGITLTFGEHLKTLKQRFQTTLAQLNRIIKPTYGLHQKEHPMVHKKECQHSHQTPQHMAPQNCPVKHGNDKANPFSLPQTLWPNRGPHGRNATKGTPAHTTFPPLTPKLNNQEGRSTEEPPHHMQNNTYVPKPTMGPNNSLNQQHIPHQRTSQASPTDPSQGRDPEGHTCFFSDGPPLTRQGGGAVAMLVNTRKELTTYVGKDTLITNFETELMALLLCQVLLQEHINLHGYPMGEAFFLTTRWPLPVRPSPEENQHPNSYKYSFTPHYTTGPKTSPSDYTGVQGMLASQKTRELINSQNWQKNHK
ncbi:hypothetical protein O181_071063 [Austropuccinia psidii MF-1]|uniref:Uncharacterized protein n=1 Tax=Austropuccinia psidii MF-1 TaxID=1389203 RepID=A0A9Q3F0B9_9BASI|nr:hypothetical protein [Austropuccinia psidii MF-1]